MSNRIKTRMDIESGDKWKLEDIYENDAKWGEDYEKVKVLTSDLVKYQGIICNNADNFLKVLDMQATISELFEKVYVYAQMRSHEDSAMSKYQDMASRSEDLAIRMSSETAFIIPEILSADTALIKDFIDSNASLKKYKRYIDEILRTKPYILSSNEEQILAKAGEMIMAPENIFNMIDNADIRYPYVMNEKGEELELTKARYSLLMDVKDREIREKAYIAFYSSYIKQKNTLAATLNANVRADNFTADVRGYKNAMTAALFTDNIDTEVYENLIKTIHARMNLMYKYVELRKKALGYDKLHMYDMYVSMVPDIDMKISFDEAKEITLNGLAVLGEDYLSKVREAYASSWIDVYENEGKRSGAYSWGCYDTHPYVLLNYNDDLQSTFTLAHEMGHAMHSYYSNNKQAYIDAGYSIFVAEVASTVNESILIRDMIDKSKDKLTKMYLINHYLEQFRATMYRQVMFAEFEKITHEAADAGETLNATRLSEIYGDLNKLYYGEDVITDEQISMEWARIPHFYSSFYVYKYATGFAAATALSNKIIKKEENALDKYLDFISSGGNDYPIEQLKKAGVDMSSVNPINEALDVFEDLLNEMEALL